MLRSALGPEVCGWLDDDGVAEVMLNPDGRLWLDRLDGGFVTTGVRMAACDAKRTIRPGFEVRALVTWSLALPEWREP
jgi:type IV secretion system protein VirB11